IVVEALAEQVADDGTELLDVLHAVHPLPLGVPPLGLGDEAPTGEPPPVGLDQLLAHVLVRLSTGLLNSVGYSRHRCHLYSSSGGGTGTRRRSASGGRRTGRGFATRCWRSSPSAGRCRTR